MKSYRVRVAVAMAVAGIALSACGPLQAGSAAIVGDQRITSSDLDADIRAFRADLAAHKMAEDQLSSGISVPQLVLINQVNTKQYLEVGRRKGVTVTGGEIDALIAAQGGQAQIDQALLGSGIPLSDGREAIRAVLIRQKLMGQFGAGADEQSQQAALAKVSQEAEALVPVTLSPRYGKFDPRQGFVADDRFGAVAAAGG